MSKDLAIYLNYDYDPSHPSVRLRRLNLRKPLRKLGIKADIIFRYEDLAPYKNILLSHFDAKVAAQCLELRKQGKKLFFCHSENLWGFPYQTEVFNSCDYIVCCSNKLAELTQPRITSPFTKCVVIPDMAEQPFGKTVRHYPNLSALHRAKEGEAARLKCVYVGMGGNSYLAKNLRNLINQMGMELVIISEHPDADIKWKLDTYLEEMARCDIAICPQNVQLQPAKSAVKVITAMSIGLPVICSPNPAYVEIVKDGVNGFIADTLDQWEAALQNLKDLELRQRFSQGSLKAAQDFTPEAIALKWQQLLSQGRNKSSIALINNTLSQKFLSYGDKVLEDLRLSGYEVEEFRYEDIDILPQGFDIYLFIEVRYDAEQISKVSPLVLYTKEPQPLNNLPHFDLIISENKENAKVLFDRGFVNVIYNDQENFFKSGSLEKLIEYDFTNLRIQHNLKLHSDHINSFYHLLPPEARWGGLRDKSHIDYTLEHSTNGSRILDIGSADGWLSVYLAKEQRQVSALEFVDRGIDWTRQQAARYGIEIDIRKGAVENVENIFPDKKFDCILCYEILEHLDYRRLPAYLKKLESLLDSRGKLLISLPSQDLNDNVEHLWSPNEYLIDKLFADKPNFKKEWFSLPDHPTPGHWFICYQLP